MLKKMVNWMLVISCCIPGCTTPVDNRKAELKNFKEGSFGFDLQFLRGFDSVIVLKGQEGQAQVIVSPKYQGKVFTSTAEGVDGKSFGWINYKAFTAPRDAHMNAYGGENRLWLGPEGGPYSLFFPKGAAMNFDNWKTPAPIDTEEWPVTFKDETTVHLEKSMNVENYAGTTLQLSIQRNISLLSKQNIDSLIGVSINDSVHTVGYTTFNVLNNTGNFEWNERTGMPCIWILDMFAPSNETTVIIPYEISRSMAKVATTNYFGDISADRIKMNNGILFFRADGKKRGKLGIRPTRAKNIAGSFDAQSNVLTITIFSINKAGKYLNQEWNTSTPPFAGDAVNAYNDGPLENGKQMGPFYEIESVSPAAFLKPGQQLTHEHSVLHFSGSKQGLDHLVKKVFGISLAEIAGALDRNGR